MPTKVTFRKKRYNNYKKGPMPLNNRQKQEVKKLISGNLELKSIDEGGAPTTSSVPTIGKWFALSQGTGNSQRVGNEISASHVQLKYELAAGDATNIVRVIVFQWMEDDVAGGPTYFDILYRPNTSVTWTNALYHYDNRHSYKIMYDRKHYIDADNDTPSAFGGSNYIRVPHKKITYNGSATNGKNMIYYLLVSDSGAVGHPAVTNQSRLYYRDA